MTDPIKAKIAELVPDVIENAHAQLIGWDNKVTYFTSYKPLTLGVVLRAIQKEFGFEKGNLPWQANTVTTLWNLEQDNYDQQSEECKQFIGSLLGVK